MTPLEVELYRAAATSPDLARRFLGQVGEGGAREVLRQGLSGAAMIVCKPLIAAAAALGFLIAPQVSASAASTPAAADCTSAGDADVNGDEVFSRSRRSGEVVTVRAASSADSRSSTPPAGNGSTTLPTVCRYWRHSTNLSSGVTGTTVAMSGDSHTK